MSEMVPILTRNFPTIPPVGRLPLIPIGSQIGMVDSKTSENGRREVL